MAKNALLKNNLLDAQALLNQAISSGLDAGYSDIDDRDIEKAPNVIDWLIGAKYLNVKPYAKQLQDAIFSFSSCCFFCSSMPYLVDIPKDEKIGNILDHCQLMKHGYCPKCKRSVVEMRYEWCLDPKNTFNGYIKPDIPNEICLIKGQRCVSGNTLVFSKENGLTLIQEIKKDDLIYTPFGWKPVLQTYQFKNRPTKVVKFSNGVVLCCGHNHKVLTKNIKNEIDFELVENLHKGNEVAFFPKKINENGFEKPNENFEFVKIEYVIEGPPGTLYDLTVPGHVYWTNRVVSHNSGKSVQTAMFSTYIAHRYLTLPNPGKYFRLLKRQVLYNTFVSVTATQAWENLWQPFIDLVEGSPWFQKYHDFLDEQGEKLGTELYNKKDTFLWYNHKHLAYSFSPADVRTLRGRTRPMAVIDEWGWFTKATDKSTKIRADGDGTWRALNNSLATVRNAANKKRKTKPDCPDAYMITISSPSSATDPIMRRSYQADKAPRMYYVKQATWDCNPDFTEESLRAQEGDVNEVTFMCDFGCVPPYSSDPWWTSEDALFGLCRKEINPEQRLFTYSIQSEPDPLTAKPWIWSKISVGWADRQTPRILTFDAGEKSCSFSWSISRFSKPDNTVIIEEVGEVAPGEGQRIHFGNMWEFTILPLVQQFRFLHVIWDHWESSTYISDLRTKHKVRAEQYTVTRADGKLLKSDMLNGLISLPKPEVPIHALPIGDNVGMSRFPRANLLYQVLTVRDGNGLPLKPQGGNDDIFRTVLLADVYVRNNIDEYGKYGNRGFGGFAGLGSGRRQGRNGLISGGGGRVMGLGPRRR